MFVNKSRNPSASEILSQLFLNKELRSRVLTTLGLLLLVRLGIYIPVSYTHLTLPTIPGV